MVLYKWETKKPNKELSDMSLIVTVVRNGFN